MKQLTKKQAITLANSRVWETWTDEEIVKFQLYQKRMCMDFSRFHAAIEKVLGRPVWTHEFAFDGIKEEHEGKRPKPTMQEILDLIPAEKRIVIGV